MLVLLLLGALYLLGKGNGSDGGGSTAAVGTQTSRTTTTPVPARTTTSSSSSKKAKSTKRSTASASKLVRVQVIATGPGPVSACLVDAAGQLRIPGATLQQSATTGTYRSKSFRLKLGNGNARVRVNGKVRSVPDVSPVAFLITRTSFKRVDAATAPDCAG